MDTQINASFKDTLNSDEALDLAKEYAEVALDSVIDEDTLKEIPIIGTIFGLYKIGSSIKDKHTLKKIAVFLNQLQNIPKEKKEAFLKKMETNDKFKESIFEKTLLLLERLDETHKAEMVGNLFRMFIMEAIDKDKFLRLSGIVERLLLYDALALHFAYSYIYRDWDGVQPYSMYHASHSSLFSQGLMEQKIVEKRSSRGRDMGYSELYIPDYTLELKITALGQDFANFILYDIKDPEFIKHLDYMSGKSSHP